MEKPDTRGEARAPWVTKGAERRVGLLYIFLYPSPYPHFDL